MENGLIISQNDLNNMSYEQIVKLEKTLEKKKVECLSNQVVIMGEDVKKIGVLVKEIQVDNKELKEQNQVLKDKVEKIQEESDKITKTLLTNGIERRNLENYLHSIIYKRLKKNSLRDELFHSTLTRFCKSHISKSLNVSSFNWIAVSDVQASKSIANAFLSREMIGQIMRKEAKRLFDISQNSKKNNGLTIGVKNARRFELLEKLLVEVGGDIDEI